MQRERKRKSAYIKRQKSALRNGRPEALCAEFTKQRLWEMLSGLMDSTLVSLRVSQSSEAASWLLMDIRWERVKRNLARTCRLEPEHWYPCMSPPREQNLCSSSSRADPVTHQHLGLFNGPWFSGRASQRERIIKFRGNYHFAQHFEGLISTHAMGNMFSLTYQTVEWESTFLPD